MAMGFGGQNLLSRTPIFSHQSMFPQQMGGSPEFIGARPGGLLSQDYFALEAARQDKQRQEMMLRRQMKQEAQTADRELSLKEMLANHQMSQEQAATGLARDRLGLDANVASADANQRQNALSLQERLGWAGEDRMSVADKNQNERFGQDVSLRERLGMMGEERMSRGQNQDESYRRAQLGQTAQLAQMPYQQRTQDAIAQSDYQDRALRQSADQYARPSGNVMASEGGQDRRSAAANALALQTHRDPSGNAVLAESGATTRANDANRLARDMNANVSGNTAATLKSQLQMWSGLSGAEKQQNAQFGANLKQRLIEFSATQSNVDREFGNLSANQLQTGQIERDRAGMTERLSGNEIQARRGMQEETLKQQMEMWNGLSAAEKQQQSQFGETLTQRAKEFQESQQQQGLQFGANLKQRGVEFDQGQKNWQTERDAPSMMQSQDLGFKQQAIDAQNRAQKFHETGVTATAREQMDAEAKSRGEHHDIQREGNQLQLLGSPHLLDLLGLDPDLPDRASSALQKLLPSSGAPTVPPGIRAGRAMYDRQVKEAQKEAAPTSNTIQDVSKQNQAAAQTLFDQYQDQGRSLQEILRAAAESDRRSPPGAESTTDSLKQKLQEWSNSRSSGSKFGERPDLFPSFGLPTLPSRATSKPSPMVVPQF